MGSDDGAEDLGGLAVGELLAEDGHTVVVGVLGFGTEFDLDLGVHIPSRLGEGQIDDGILASPPPLDTDALGEGTEFITSHRAESGEGGGLKE